MATLVATLGWFWIAVIALAVIAVSFIARVAMKTGMTNQTTTTQTNPTQPQANQPQRPAAQTPAKVSTGSIIITAAVTTLVVGLVTFSIVHSWMQPLQPKPTWGNVTVLHLSDKPVTLDWPDGATNVRLDPLVPTTSPRKYKVKSGDREFLLDINSGVWHPYPDKPLTFTSADGQPLGLTIQWKQ